MLVHCNVVTLQRWNVVTSGRCNVGTLRRCDVATLLRWHSATCRQGWIFVCMWMSHHHSAAVGICASVQVERPRCSKRFLIVRQFPTFPIYFSTFPNFFYFDSHYSCDICYRNVRLPRRKSHEVTRIYIKDARQEPAPGFLSLRQT